MARLRHGEHDRESEGEVMAMCVWTTRDMFERYIIINSANLARAVAQRLSVNGKQTTNKTSQPIEVTWLGYYGSTFAPVAQVDRAAVS